MDQFRKKSFDSIQIIRYHSNYLYEQYDSNYEQYLTVANRLNCSSSESLSLKVILHTINEYYLCMGGQILG